MLIPYSLSIGALLCYYRCLIWFSSHGEPETSKIKASLSTLIFRCTVELGDFACCSKTFLSFFISWRETVLLFALERILCKMEFSGLFLLLKTEKLEK